MANAVHSNCKSKKDCPKVQPDFAATAAANGTLIGLVGKSVHWELRGLDLVTRAADGVSSSRQVVVLLDRIPTGSRIVPAPHAAPLASNVRLIWTPDQEQKGTLDIILRDQERCEINENPKRCQAYEFIAAYDTRIPARPWEIRSEASVLAEAADKGVDPAEVGSLPPAQAPQQGCPAKSGGEVVFDAFLGIISGGLVPLLVGDDC